MLDSLLFTLAGLLFVVGMSWYGNAASSPPALLQDSTPASIANSIAVTTLASLTLPANSIGVNGVLEFFVWIRYVNNSAVNAQNPIITVNLGGVQIGGITRVSAALVPSANTYGYYCHIWLKNKNVANAQSVLCWNVVSDAARQFTAAFPDTIDAASQRSVAIDTTIDNLLTVTAQNDLADPAYITSYDGLQVKAS